MGGVAAVLVVSSSVKDAVYGAGITYRQFDYWWRMGWIGDGSEPGQGHRRKLTPEQVSRIRKLAALVNAGLSPEVAARALSRARTSRRGRTYIAIGDVQIIVGAA